MRRNEAQCAHGEWMPARRGKDEPRHRQEAQLKWTFFFVETQTMSPRVTWKGSLNVSLVSLAVKAYTATAPENGQLRLNQLHAACHGRIKYEKTCPLHGAVASDQIVMGYQYASTLGRSASR